MMELSAYGKIQKCLYIALKQISQRTQSILIKGTLFLTEDPVTQATHTLHRRIIPFWNCDNPNIKRLPLLVRLKAQLVLFRSFCFIIAVRV